MDGYLKSNLNTAVYNMDFDWDFVFIISGDGMVRVGKSVLAQQIGYYIAYKKGTPFSMENICFTGEQLINTAHHLPKNSVLIYDEAREGLDAKKTMESMTKSLLDFFAECGMYNDFIIVILPDFFELNKNIAISRSDALINVFRTSKDRQLSNGDNILEYERGHFEFYNRKEKRELYIKGKKLFCSYDIGKRNFYGEFKNYWVVNKEEYLKKKIAHIQRVRAKKDDKFLIVLKALCKDNSQRKVAEILSEQGLPISQTRINQLLNQIREKTIEK